MQCYTIFFITVNAQHVSGSFSTHHQELKNCAHSIGYMSRLFAATVSVGELELPTHPMLVVAANKVATNKMQRYTIFFITVNALHVLGNFSAHHQELKNCAHSIGYVSRLLAAAASMGELEFPTLLAANASVGELELPMHPR